MRKVKPGDEVRITFFDHSLNSKSDNILECQARGRVFSVDQEKIVLDWWTTEEAMERHPGENLETTAFIKSAITKIELLEPTRDLRP
jgi:hypothetical protein